MALFLPSPFADAQWNQDKKDAGSKFKNVTVLAQMPADQMGKVMNMMSASLGVNCSFCHEGTNFAKEGIGQKDAGRKMISMTLGINNEFFEGKAEVTCNTCHQGKTIPTSSISLNRAPVIPGIKNNQPHINFTPDEILEKHIQSIGGRKKLESIKSRHVIAKRLEPHGGREPEELWQTATGLTRMVTHYGKVTVVEGFDGTQAWKHANENKIDLKPDEAEQIRMEATMAFGLGISASYSELTFQSLDRIDDHEIIVLSGLSRISLRERLFFEASSGMLRRRSSSVPTVLGAFEYQVDYEEYKDFGGVLQPTKLRFAVPNITWTREVTNVELNVEIDESEFRNPN